MNARFRLRKSAEVQRVRQAGKVYAHPLLLLIVLKNDLQQPRFAVSASRAIGKAVQRNRAKRRIRAALQTMMASIEPGWDLLVLARPPATKATFQETRSALLALLKRANLVKEKHGNSIR